MTWWFLEWKWINVRHNRSWLQHRPLLRVEVTSKQDVIQLCRFVIEVPRPKQDGCVELCCWHYILWTQFYTVAEEARGSYSWQCITALQIFNHSAKTSKKICNTALRTDLKMVSFHVAAYYGLVAMLWSSSDTISLIHSNPVRFTLNSQLCIWNNVVHTVRSQGLWDNKGKRK